MNRINNTLLGAVLFAGSIAGGSALAADKTTDETTSNKGDPTQVAPAREDLKPGAAPSVERMDDNAQRQHDADGKAGGAAGAGTGADSTAGTGAGAAAAGSTSGADSSAGSTGTAAAGGGETRDWAAVDTNSDNLISPDEMEKALEAQGPQAGQKR